MRMTCASLAMGALAASVLACGETKTSGPAVDTGAAIKAESTRLIAFLDAQFDEELAQTPEAATRLGRKDNDDKLNDSSEAQQDRMLKWRRQSVAAMKAQFDRATLDQDAQVDYDIWMLELDRAERAIKFRRHAYVFGYSSVHTELPNFLISFHRVDSVAMMEAYTSRVGQLGRVMDQAVERAKAAATDGIRVPQFQYDRVSRESQQIISGTPFSAGPNSPLWADATGKIKKLVDAGKATPEQAKTLTDGLKKAMLEGMKPGYERLIAWAKADMANAKSGKVGAVTLPDGLNWYAAALANQTTTDLTADQIHALGLSEVERIHGEMDKLAQSTGVKDRGAFVAERSEKKELMLPPTDLGRAEYLKLANAAISDSRSKIPALFGNLPKYDMVVQREPAFSEVPGGAAHAQRATPDGSKPGVVFVHLLTPGGYLRTEIPDLMCHEGVPGHLLQGDIMVRQTGVPKFRTAYGYVAFGEGWGLYSETLCKEMGLYKDAYEDYARLEWELWRAVRLVVDTGLHGKGWSEDEGVKYAQENTAQEDAFIHQEVRRFLLNPGQACGYKLGQLAISRLRGEAEKELGPAFEVKSFHDMVVGGGSLPLSILETRVKVWVAAKKGPVRS